MEFEEIIDYLTENLGFNPWGLFKILFLFGLLIYLAFAGIIARQVGLMTQTLNTEFETPLKLVALIHLLAAVGIFLLAIIIL